MNEMHTLLRQCFIAGVMAASGQPVRLGERLACALAMPVSAGLVRGISGRALSFAAKCAIIIKYHALMILVTSATVKRLFQH